MNIWRNLCVVAMLVVVSFLGGCAKDAPVEAKAGDKLPEIILVDQHNQPFNLNNATERAPIVLIYYRGGWCPYCNTHLSELRKIELQIKKKGYLLFAVSPDSPKELAKSTAKHKMGYTLLSDSKMTGAQALGIALKVDDETIMKYKGYGIDLDKASGEDHHLLPKPAVFVIERGGIIKFAYVNADYKVRLSNAEILDAL